MTLAACFEAACAGICFPRWAWRFFWNRDTVFTRISIRGAALINVSALKCGAYSRAASKYGMYIHRQPKLGGGLGPSFSNKIRILPVTVAFCGCFLCPLCKFKAIRGRGADFHTSVVVLHTRLQHCESLHLDPLPWPRTALNLHKGHRKQPQKATVTGRLRLFWFYYWSPWFIEKAKIAISIPKLGPRLPPSLGCLWYIKIVAHSWQPWATWGRASGGKIGVHISTVCTQTVHSPSAAGGYLALHGLIQRPDVFKVFL